MKIRMAKEKDAKRLYDMLATVQKLHADGRPDVFIAGTHKYEIAEILEILACENTPVFVADEDGEVAGYAFCEIINSAGTNNLKARKTYYIDDLCVNEKFRGKGVGKLLYEHALNEAKKEGCDSLTLNVWHLNKNAVGFYEHLGMKPLKTTMETII